MQPDDLFDSWRRRLYRLARRLFAPAEWRWRWTRFVGFFVRGWRGWANHDVWGADTYLALVMAGMLRRLAEIKHGVPGAFLPGQGDHEITHAELDAGDQAFKAWLLDKAEWLEWYYRDDDGTTGDTNWIEPGLTPEVISGRIEAHMAKMERFYNEVMPDLVKHWGSLWD